MLYSWCRVDVVIFVIWELIILSFLVFSAVSLYFRHIQLTFVLVCITMLLIVCMKVTKQMRLARKKKRRMLLPLSMWKKTDSRRRDILNFFFFFFLKCSKCPELYSWRNRFGPFSSPSFFVILGSVITREAAFIRKVKKKKKKRKRMRLMWLV